MSLYEMLQGTLQHFGSFSDCCTVNQYEVSNMLLQDRGVEVEEKESTLWVSLY
jgi:hypothetical protein